MKNLLVISVLVALAISCKKDKEVPPTPNPRPQHSFPYNNIQRIEKNWVLDGYHYYAQHPSGDTIHSFSDTTYITDVQQKIDIIDDTTIAMTGKAFNGKLTYTSRYTDTTKGYIVFDNYAYQFGQGIAVTYYYHKDSMVFTNSSYGVSFTRHTELHSK